MAFVNNLAYEASAGSGKTFMLVVRYLSLLFLGAKPSKILALTFTNKAANEMQERIVATLEELEQRKSELEEIAKVTELRKECLLQHRERILNEFLNAHTKIMTIDSFFTQILRKFSLYVSLMPDFSTSSSQHELKLLSRFLKEVRVARKKETLVNLSLFSQRRITDIFELLDELYIKFAELGGIEFTKQNSEQFEQEALALMEELKKIVVANAAASSTAIRSVEAESFEDVVSKKWLERESLNYSTFAKCYTPEMDILLLKIKDAIKAQNRAKEQNFFYALKELVTLYIKSKKALYKEDSELGFSDVTYLVYEILNHLDDRDFLYFRLDAQIEHMLLDEFQDTSILQYEILKPLIREITSGKGIFDNGSFFFVGDVKQSIYRFRGGVSALFDAVREENATEVKKLLTNYRSQKEVVAFVNRVFTQKIKNYTPQLVQDGAEDGYVAVVQNDEVLDEVVLQVQRLLQSGADANEIAVLCATNGDGIAVQEALQAHNIEVVTETTTKLINQKSIKALLEYLKYQYFGEEIYKENFFALLLLPPRAIPRVDCKRATLVGIVKEAIEEFGLFEDDLGLMRFLEEIRRYSDIEALLFEYERMEASAAASELEGVRVLTIHKSKGLEYAHVLVMDRLTKAPNPRDTIIYEYDGITLQNIYLRISGRDIVDPSYAAALQKEKQLAYEDSLNALYVALTRAKESLIIIAKTKDSLFTPLELCAQEHGVLRCKKEMQKPQQSLPPLVYKELYYGVQGDILAVVKNYEEDLESIHFGLAMHFMLEMLTTFEVKSIELAKEMTRNKYGALLGESGLEELQKRVTMLIEEKQFLCLAQGELLREKALRYKNALFYIDLLVQNSDGYRVIDYKSSLAFAQEHYRQVSSYVRAVEEITHQKVEGYIVYLLQNCIKIVQVEKNFKLK